MVRKEILIASVLTVAGFAVGYWLLPEEADVARMEVRDYNYNDPEQLFEARFRDGDHSVDVVQQLVRIHTNTGNIDRAIEVLRTYVEENPQDTTALKQLGQLYQFAQRYEDYMAILEARAEGTKDPVVLTEMSQLYNFFQQTEQQKITLQRLYEVEEGSNPQTIRDLVSFYSVDKDFANVARLSEDLFTKHPEEYLYEDAVAHTNALLEMDEEQQAVELVQNWRKMGRSSDEETAFLVDMLHYQGAPSHARTILSTIPDEEIYASPDLLHSYLLVMVAEGHQDDAYRLLSTLYERNELPEMLLPDLMYMAAANGNTERFHELREKSGLTRLPENQLADIWISSRRSNQTSVMRAVSQHVSQSAPNDYPLLRTLILIDERSPG
ncbi:MAG: tetratricopeptide repeat protein, partial [Alphaproteobacteria bacterium]|nr:tetratricopeptide repeat protein [Alphaproteobacteria bacterium]